jgi:hypothetical protein
MSLVGNDRVLLTDDKNVARLRHNQLSNFGDGSASLSRANRKLCARCSRNSTQVAYASGHDASDPDTRHMFECLLAYARREGVRGGDRAPLSPAPLSPSASSAHHVTRAILHASPLTRHHATIIDTNLEMSFDDTGEVFWPGNTWCDGLRLFLQPMLLGTVASWGTMRKARLSNGRHIGTTS